MINIDINKKLYGSNGEMTLKVKLDIKDKEFIVLTGTSGSGKTTLLRILAGLEESDSHIKVNDEVWQDDTNSLPPQNRKIGFVFQDYALFPNMSVEENLLYVKNDKKLADHLLNITQLTKLKNRLPQTLSGGQKQRVALCRAMMNKPKLLLLDEPLSALDIGIKSKLHDEILSLHKEFGTTTIMVTHDISEMYKLSNRIVTLDNGQIIEDVETNDSVAKGKFIKFSKDNTKVLVEVDNKIIEVELPKE